MTFAPGMKTDSVRLRYDKRKTFCFDTGLCEFMGRYFIESVSKKNEEMVYSIQGKVEVIELLQK